MRLPNGMRRIRQFCRDFEQRLRPLGFQGGHSIVRMYVRKLRTQVKPRRAFLRTEPPPGERFEVDWGHFGTLTYSGDVRKIHAFA